MRIFTAIRHSNDPSQFYGGLWSANFYPALRELGNEIIESQTDLLPTSRFMDIAAGFTREELEARAATTDRILAEVRAARRQGPIHLFLSYFYNSHFDPAGFDHLRRWDIPSVNFYCNSIYQFAQVSAIAAKVDTSWHAERDARARYLAAGARPIWVQMGADPLVYRPISTLRRQSKACFVGQRYADRDQWAAALLKAAIPLDLYGSGWAEGAATDETQNEKDSLYLGRVRPRPGSVRSYWQAAAGELKGEGVGRGVRRILHRSRNRSASRHLTPLLKTAAKGRADRVAETFATHEVVVNFSNVWADGRPGSRLIPHVRLRDFEAPMCRACYLTGHSDELAEFYKIGSEIDTYRTPEELVEKTRHYLANPEAAERLRAAGYERARRDHTWVRRFEQLFQYVGVCSQV